MADRKSTKLSVLISAFLGESEVGFFPDFIRTMLEEHFNVIVAEEGRTNPELLKQVVGVFTTSGTPQCLFLKEFLPQLPNLKALATNSAGVDHLDLSDLAAKGINVCSLGDAVAKVTADMAFGLLLCQARKIIEGAAISKSLPAGSEAPQTLLGKDVYDSTLGIVGLGRIGLQVARRARGFDMDILYHNRNRRSLFDEELSGATYVSSLHEMLPRCDYVVISCPHTQQTTKLFGPQQFALMKPDAVLVNIARGAIVDTDALVDALKNGTIGGAALDVTDPEPLPPGHALLSLQTALVVPHLGSATKRTRRKMFQLSVNNLKAVLIDGHQPIHEATSH